RSAKARPFLADAGGGRVAADTDQRHQGLGMAAARFGDRAAVNAARAGFSSAGRAPCSQVDGAGDQERANEPRRLRWFFTRHFGAPASSPVSQRRNSMEKQPALSRPDICPKSRQYPTAHPEVELKLLASPAAIERIRQAPVIKRHARNRGV